MAICYSGSTEGLIERLGKYTVYVGARRAFAEERMGILGRVVRWGLCIGTGPYLPTVTKVSAT